MLGTGNIDPREAQVRAFLDQLFNAIGNSKVNDQPPNPPLPQPRPNNAPLPPLGQRPQIAPQLMPHQQPGMPQPQIPMGPAPLGAPQGMQPGRPIPMLGISR